MHLYINKISALGIYMLTKYLSYDSTDEQNMLYDPVDWQTMLHDSADWQNICYKTHRLAKYMLYDSHTGIISV